MVWKKKKKSAVYNLRRYLKKLYEGYPTHYFYGYEKVENIEEGIQNLLDDGIIKGKEFNSGYKQGKSLQGAITLTHIIKRQYRLTAEGLRLVESWGIEKLTKLVTWLTIGLFII